MPISPSEFEVVDEGKGTKWEDFEAVPDPKALATGVGAGMDLTNRLLGTLQAGAIPSQMGQQQGRRIRADQLATQAQRAAAMAGGGTVSPTGPGMPQLPEEDVAGLKAAALQGPLSLVPEEAPPATTGPMGARLPPQRFDLGAEAAKPQEPFGLTPSARPSEGFQAPDLKPPSTLDAVTEGVGESALGTADFMLSPAGIATLGMGAFAKPVQRLISLAFAGQMGASMKDAAKELGTEFGKPADQRDTKKISKLVTDIISGGTFAAVAGFHGARPAADLPMPFMNRFGNRPLEGPPAEGSLLATPRGAPVPRAEEVPGLERATSEQAAAQARAMQRRATAAFEPAGPERPVVPEGPSDPRVTEIQGAGLREIRQILKQYPDLKGNREAARALRDQAFPEIRKEADATNVEREPEHIGTPPGADVPPEPTEVRPGAGEPDSGSSGVVSGAEEQAPVSPEVKPPTEEPPTAEGGAPVTPPTKPTAPAAPGGAAPGEGSLEHVLGQTGDQFFETGQKWSQESMAGKGPSLQVLAEREAQANPDLKKWEAAKAQIEKEQASFKEKLKTGKMEDLQKEMFGLAQKGQFVNEGIKILKGKVPEKEAAPAVSATPAVEPSTTPAQAAATPAEPSLAEKVVSFVESEAAKAEARLRSSGTTFGSGPLHELPNIRDYAIIGAAKIARFGLDKAKFAAEMLKKFGERIRPHLDQLFDDASEIFARSGERVKNQHTPVQEIIDATTGAAMAPRDTISQVIDTMQTSLRTVRALKDHFEGQPKVSRAEVKIADDFLEADANKIRESLTELARTNLPVSERGKFLRAVANATRRSPILTGDPETMYGRAAKVAAAIDEYAEKVQTKEAVADIKKGVEKALASPTVDIAFKSKIRAFIGDVSFTKPTEATIQKLGKIRDYISKQEALGKDVEMPKEILKQLEILHQVPLKELPLHVLEAMRDRIGMLEEMGRRTVATRQLRWENEKAVQNRELATEDTNPIDKRPEFRAQPGDPTPPSTKIGNWIKRRMDGASLIDKALLPVDALFDLLGDAKGAYKGWLFKHVRNPIDLGFNGATVQGDRITKPLTDLIKANKLGEQNAERIGVYAALQQEGGRERLVAMGVTPETIAKIERTMTPAEMSAYHAMRTELDNLLPQVQKLMHELYNIPVEPVENYFPMPRDWTKVEIEPKAPAQPKFGEEMAFDDLAGWKELYGDYIPKTTKTERGFTIERKPGAESAIKINAFEVFDKHVKDVAYLLNTQRDIKMIGELAKGDLFAEKYGKVGQSMVLNWLDTVARQGHTGNRIAWIDALRKNTSAGVIGFRLASQFVHLSNIPLAMERTGVLNYGSGLQAALTDKGEKFLRANFAETFARGGGEPALVEAQEEGVKVLGMQVATKKLVRAGFAIARQIDQKNSQATVLGMYFKGLKEKGIDPSQYAELPVDKDAQSQALVMARRAVASPLPKDVPMALSRGAFTKGNVSLGRAMFQFQNIFLDQWSNIRHDLMRAGVREANPVKAARLTFALAVMVAAETGIRETSKEIIQELTGSKPKKEPAPGGKVAVEVLRRFPFMGQLTAMAMYGETGIPLLDSVMQVPRQAYRAATAKTEKASDRAVIGAVAGAAQLAGVPGSSQIGEVIQKSQ